MLKTKLFSLIFLILCFLFIKNTIANPNDVGEIQKLINKYGKFNIASFIMDKNHGRITIQIDRQLKTAIGLPQDIYITVYSIDYDFKRMGLSPQKADISIANFIEQRKIKQEIKRKLEKQKEIERQRQDELEKKRIEEKQKQEELQILEKKKKEEEIKAQLIKTLDGKIQNLKQNSLGESIWIKARYINFLHLTTDIKDERYPNEGKHIKLNLFDKLTIVDVVYTFHDENDIKFYMKVTVNDDKSGKAIGFLPFWLFEDADNFFYENPKTVFKGVDDKMWEKALNKEIAIGMPEDLVSIIYGKPSRVVKEVNSSGIFKQYIYKEKRYLYFKDGILISWRETD